MRNIHSVSYKVCSSELAALILESTEIRRFWPQYNRSQKKYHHQYGLYTYEDQNGYLRLFIEKKKKHLTPVYTFNLLHEGQVILKKMIDEFGLNEGALFCKQQRGALFRRIRQTCTMRKYEKQCHRCAGSYLLS